MWSLCVKKGGVGVCDKTHSYIYTQKLRRESGGETVVAGVEGKVKTDFDKSSYIYIYLLTP